MEIPYSHNTHNLSESSSEEQNDKKNDKYTSSSDKEYYVKNDSEIEWANIIKRNNIIKPANHSILNESEINLSNNYRLEQLKKKDLNINVKNIQVNQNQEQDDSNNNNKDSKNILGNNFRVLNNGFIVKNLNKFKKGTIQSMDVNPFCPSEKEKNLINIKMSNNPNHINNNINCFYPKFKKVKKKKSLKILIIKKPNRAFFTKEYKCRKPKNKKSKENKKIYHSASAQNAIRGLGSKYLPNSSRISRINTLPNIKLHSKEKEDKKLKSSFHFNNSKINRNFENKLFPSSINDSKKLSVTNNISLYFSRSKNYLIKKDSKKRTLSSINIQGNETNSKKLKLVNFDINENNNRSFRKLRARPMSSMMNSQIHPRGKKEIKEKENIIFENANFVNQFKELKNAFDTCENNKMNNGDKNTKKINDYNFIDFYTKYRENNKGKITKNRKLNSVKLNKTSYNHFFPKRINSLYNFDFKNIYEEENNSRFCKNCGYQKHFGNEKICPVCIALKEQSNMIEEKWSNKYYYFPFKDKYEGSYSVQTSFRRSKNDFKNITIGKILNNNNNFYLKYININKDNKNSFNNSFYLNSILASPNNIIRKKLLKRKSKNKSMRKNRSQIINKYDAIKKYFA